MQDATEAAVTCLKDLFEQEPGLFPDDRPLMKAGTQENWRGVLKQLVVIRDSQSQKQRIQHFCEATSINEPSCMAEVILQKVMKIYMDINYQAIEQQLINSL